MDMDWKVKKGVLVVEPFVSRLDASVSSDFKETLAGLLKGGQRRLLINMNQVDFIDSTGMTVLVSLLKLMGTEESEIMICNVRGGIRNLFKLTKLDRVFPIFGTEDDVLAQHTMPA